MHLSRGMGPSSLARPAPFPAYPQLCSRPYVMRALGLGGEAGKPQRPRPGRVPPARYSPERAEHATAKQTALEVQKEKLRTLSAGELRRRLKLLGEETAGILDQKQLRNLLATRLLSANADVVSLPLRRTPKNSKASKSYVVIPVDVQDIGFVDFLLDTASSGCLITSEMRELLGMSPVAGAVVKGLDATGVTLRQKVALPELRLGSRILDISEGYVTALKTEHDGDVGGVLGLRFLSSFQIELDPAAGSIAFHPVGHVERGVLDVSGMRRLVCTPLKGGLLGIPASLNGSHALVGILDLGSNFSTINWSAAALAGVMRPGSTAQVISGDGQSNTVCKKNSVCVRLGSVSGAGSLGPSCSRPAPGQAAEQAGSSTNSQRTAMVGLQSDVYAPAEQPALLVRDVPGLATLGFKDTPAMIIGKDIIGCSRTVFCLASNTIWVQE